MLGILVVEVAGKGKQNRENKELSFPLNFSMHWPLTLTDIPRPTQCNTGKDFCFHVE